MVPKKNAVQTPLSMTEIVMRADLATIRAALEAREKVDALLAERAAAYERIAALEKQVDEVMGAPGVFVFPPPSVQVAAYAAVTPAAAATKSSAPSTAPTATAPAVSHQPSSAPAPSAAAPAHSGDSRRSAAAAPKASQN